MGAWSVYAHCAELPQSTLAAHKELAKWLAGCNGELRFAMTSPECYTYLAYNIHEADKPVPLQYAVRKWGELYIGTPRRENISDWRTSEQVRKTNTHLFVLGSGRSSFHRCYGCTSGSTLGSLPCVLCGGVGIMPFDSRIIRR